MAYLSKYQWALRLWWHVAITILLLSPAQAATSPINKQENGFAIHGYDTVAYFTQGKPMRGSSDYVAEYAGARWAFTTAEHKKLFEGDPEKYAPQYGGHCAFAAAHNALSDVDPTAWNIVEGKLYLNYGQQVARSWLGNLSTNLEKGDRFWFSLTKP